MSVRAPATPGRSGGTPTRRRELLLPYALLGIYLGVVFTKSEVISWFRIQEMFRFQAFHMYGIIASAVAVAAAGVWLIRWLDVRTFTGRPMEAPIRRAAFPGYPYWVGGALFGVGWALLGACPGPIYVLIGNGLTVMIAALGAAVSGAWTYGLLRHRIYQA